jgi:uncharacterized protein (TIGR02596 family)
MIGHPLRFEVNLHARLPSSRSRRAAGFTLLELMLIVIIVTLLVALATTSFKSSLSSQQINAAALRLSGDLNQAAQLAITRNQTIAVVFLREKHSLAGEFDPLQYRGWQLHALNPKTGALEPLDEPSRLEGGMILMNHEAYSSILHRELLAEGEPRALRFKPAGGTDLPTGPDKHWCLTLALETEATKEPNVLPKSSRTLVVNGHTGMVTVY